MIKSSLFFLALVLGSMAVAMALAGAWLTFWSSAQTKEQESAVRRWFRKKWETISRSPWLYLPEKIIHWLLRWKSILIKYSIDSVHRLDRLSIRELLWYGLGGLLSLFFILRNLDRVPPFAFYLIVGGYLLAIPIAYLVSIHYEGIARRLLGYIAAACIFLPFSYLLLVSILDLPLWISALLLPSIAFFFYKLLSMSFENMAQEGGDMNLEYITFGWAISASFVITFWAMLIGHYFQPTLFVPKTFQMLFSNVLCDSATIVITLSLLSLAVGSQKRISVPVAILIDLAVAVLLAYASLWLGLAFTDKALSLREIGYVLIGRSPNGNSWELGPYFFVMHTTFLPTLLYLSIVLLCWLGKIFLIGVNWFLGKAQHPDINPLGLTAGFLGFIAALLGAFAFLVGVIQQFVS